MVENQSAGLVKGEYMDEKLEQAKSVETTTIELLKLSRGKDKEISEAVKKTIQRKSTEKALNWIFENSQAAKSELVKCLGRQKKDNDKQPKWIWAEDLNALDIVKDSSGIFYYTTKEGKGRKNAGKGAYIWLSIRHNGNRYAIFTFWQDVDQNFTWNIHQYFGQISFVLSNCKYDETANPNRGCTTVWELRRCCRNFEAFILSKGHQTVRNRRNEESVPKLTVDNLLNGKIEPEKVIKLFEEWVVEQEPKNVQKPASKDRT
jgi:hypothetical protein